jgi:hypothetical protein
MQYWYPLTNPLRTVLGNSEILISAFMRSNPPAGERLYRPPNLLGRGDVKIRPNDKDDVRTSRIHVTPQPE